MYLMLHHFGELAKSVILPVTLSALRCPSSGIDTLSWRPVPLTVERLRHTVGLSRCEAAREPGQPVVFVMSLRSGWQGIVFG